MNIRLSEGAIRFRVSSDEFSKLKEKGVHSGKTKFPGGNELCYKIQLQEGETQLNFSSSEIVLSIPPKELDGLGQAFKREAVEKRFEIPLEAAQTLQVSFEIDLFSKRRVIAKH